MLTGGGAQLKNIKELSELITTTDTRIGIPNEHLDAESVSYNELMHPMYATGIGLVLYGLEEAEKCCNPEAEVEEEPETKTKDIFADMMPEPEKPVEKTPETPEKKTKEKKGPGKFEKVLGDFFSSVFGEGIDD